MPSRRPKQDDNKIRVTVTIPVYITVPRPAEGDDDDRSVTRETVMRLAHSAVNAQLEREGSDDNEEGKVELGRPAIVGMGHLDVSQKRVLVLKEHHGTRYMDVSTQEMLEAAALKIIKGRFDPKSKNGLYMLPSHEDDEPQPPAMTKDQIAKLPAGQIKSAGEEEWRQFEERQQYFKRSQQQTEAIAECIAHDNAKLALAILKSRSRYEYEHFEIETVDEEYRV